MIVKIHCEDEDDNVVLCNRRWIHWPPAAPSSHFHRTLHPIWSSGHHHRHHRHYCHHRHSDSLHGWLSNHNHLINDHCIDHPSRSHNLITSNFTAPSNPPVRIFGTFYHCSDENPQLQVLTKRFSGLSPSGHSPPSQHCHGHRNSHCRQCHRLFHFHFPKVSLLLPHCHPSSPMDVFTWLLCLVISPFHQPCSRCP